MLHIFSRRDKVHHRTYKSSTSSAFTLLEILLVVGIIAILAGIVIVAINPAKQLGSSRDAERKGDINTIYKAVNQYLIDNGTLPTGITTSAKVICDTDGLPSGCLNLNSLLVPNYLQAIPKDPSATSTGGAGYYITKVGGNIYVEAPLTEVGFTKQAGYSSTTPIVAFVGARPDGYIPPAVGSGIVSGGGGGGVSHLISADYTWVGSTPDFAIGHAGNYGSQDQYLNICEFANIDMNNVNNRSAWQTITSGSYTVVLSGSGLTTLTEPNATYQDFSNQQPQMYFNSFTAGQLASWGSVADGHVVHVTVTAN